MRRCKGRSGRNPLRGWLESRRRPKVAEYGNLGLWAATLFGVGFESRRRPKVAEYGNLGLWATTPSGLARIATASQGSRVRQPWAMGHNPFGVGSGSSNLTFL
jgi:hypothetical protein